MLRRRLVFALLGAAALAACDAGASTVEDAGRDAPPAMRDAWTYASPAACDIDAGPSPPPVVECNGHPELCSRAYDEVAYVTTHNAMNATEEGFRLPNQEWSLWHQLERGVRGFMLDVHEGDAGVVSLCHGPCTLGSRPLADGLRDLAVFLDCHPGEVLTIIFESYVTEAQIEAGFVDSGLIRYVRPQTAGEPWPTLGEMIAANERVVVFTADSSRTLPWHLYSYDFAWENPYHAEAPAELSCAEDRGSRSASLWIFNHFLTAPLASRDLASMINYDPFFSDQVATCRADAAGDLPNFVTVDFVDIGDTFAVVDALNGF